MHIVEIPSFFPPYGGEFCIEQSKALQAFGHEVRIISNVQLSVKRSVREFLTLPYDRRFIEIEGIPDYQSYMRGIPKVIRPNVERWMRIVREMFQTYMKRYGKPDILHAHCAKWAGYAAMLMAREYDIPYVITEHLPFMIFKEEFGSDGADAWQVPLLREAYQHADRVIPVSEEVVTDLAPFFGHDYHWTAVSNVIDVDFFAYRKRPPLDGRPFRFCCIGNFIYRKGYDVLFKAFRLLSETNPEIELHIAGAGTDSSACQQAMHRLGGHTKIVAHGCIDRESVRALLYDCDALALATRDETQGLVLLEAMSTGIPVVTTEAVPQCVRIAGGCWVAPIDDAHAFCALMNQVIEDQGDQSEAVSKRVGEMAAPPVVATRLTQVFQECIAARQRV
ncbi:MAG: glycosyltransferase family 4 protein [Prevotella sp.]|nr:glycosyltransferase family 4 protein [Prevotella sp.]